MFKRCAFALFFLLAGCGLEQTSIIGTQSPKKATSKPYIINGIQYTPQHHYELEETGIASHYGGPDRCHGSFTSTGERFDMFELTAAHKTLPLPCFISVENLENGKTIVLKVNDRGPFIENRIVDVSARAAQLLGFYEKGVACVRLRTLVEQSRNLPENQPGFKYSNACKVVALEKNIHASIHRNKDFNANCNTNKSMVAANSFKKAGSSKIYLEIHTTSFKHALAIEDYVKSHGVTDLFKNSKGDITVSVGPFSSISKAQFLQKNLSLNCQAAIVKK